MPMNKIQDVKLETTATYQPLSDLNVRFWNQDKNTAELRFIITRNQSPLSLSKENVKVIIALESGASFISSDDFIIDSEVEGIARYIIPNDFMRLANNVTGQVYVTTLDGEEIIVERQFKFTVSNDLLNDYPSEDKLRYIKTFDDLRTEIASRVSKLESDMETMEDYVTQVQDTTQSGIKELNNLVKSNEEKLQHDYDDKINTINSKGQEYSDKFDEYKSDIDEKKSDFEKSVTDSGLVTTGESKDWQKYKLTTDDGSYKYIDIKKDLASYQALAPGLYYTANAPISGIGQTSATGFTTVEQRQNYPYLKRITFRPYNSNQEFVMRYYNEWLDWENALANVETTQGSQAKATTAENNARQYTDAKVANIHTVLYEGSANGVGTNLELNDSLDNFIVLYIYGTYPGGSFITMSNPFDKSSLVVTNSNIINNDGNGGGIYECVIEQTSRTKLKISNDVFFDLGTQTGSGANANKTTITRIIGVRKNEINY